MLLQIFRSILTTSVVGGILAVLLLLIKPITRRWFGSVWQYYAWSIVLIVMVLPVTIRLPQKNTNIGPEEFINTQYNIVDKTVEEELENMQIIPLQSVEIEPYVQSKVNVLKSISFDPALIDMVCCVWLSGLILILVINISRYAIFLRAILKNSMIISCPGIDTEKIIIRKTNMMDAPLMLGIFRPVLLLPDIEISEKELNYILLHELTHFKRCDIWYKWFTMFVNTIHWFNPLAYIVSRQIDEECEISCDLSVVANMNESEQKGYMNTILVLVSRTSKKTKLLTTAMASNKKQIKRRFTMIKNATKKDKITIIVSVIIACLILGISVFVSGVLSGKVKAENLEDPNGFTSKAGNSSILENKTNILLIGVDGGLRADTLMILSLDRSNNRLGVLSIPRDTLVIVDDQDRKMSELMSDDDCQEIIDAVNNNLEIPVNYYARIEYDGFRNIIDTLGGVEFNVPMDMVYEDPAQNLSIFLEEGLQVLDGEKAEYLVRYRAGYPGGDITRVQMQQSFITELIKQKLDTKYLSEIDELYKELSKCVATNYPPELIVEDIKAFTTINTMEIEAFVLPGTTELRQSRLYFIVDNEELKCITSPRFSLE